MSATSRDGQVPYLYERLGPDRFQRLCAALLALEFPNSSRAFPAGPDGGRDGAVRNANAQAIYQVKWSKDPVRNPVSWLESAIRAEAPKIRSLVAAGATDYVLMTSVIGTGVAGSGSIDRFDAILQQWSAKLGLTMRCLWRSDIDARVDAAPRELKWSYAEMLAGNDSIRFLLEADKLEGAANELRSLMLKVVGSQEADDARVKFKQVELDVYSLEDLFVDVEAIRLPTSTRRGHTPEGSVRTNVGGAARYLLDRAPNFTLVRGEPGQGKSTLGQFISQVNRHALLRTRTARSAIAPAPANIRFPLRVDLRDYASWLSGEDPFAPTPTNKRRRLSKSQGSLEAFLSALMESHSGGLLCSPETVHEILARFPVLLVLDGLDEVGLVGTRELVVAEIEEFVGRHLTDTHPPQLVVTTRPNASNLPEPSSAEVQVVELAKLSRSLRTEYLRKWADVNKVRGPQRRSLENTFRERSAEPHIALLAQNPMQLTILLYLIHKRGDSVPSARTPLYTSYVETLLDREGEKSRAVVEHRAVLEEVTSYLGWNLQSTSEGTDATGRLAIKALKQTILNYLFEVEKPTDLVEDLFTTVTDRVWALTSKVEGTFEFDVQPIREYFAARFLYQFAGADNPDFDSADLLRELVRRPYWLNVCRFYVGFATPNELAGLVMGLRSEFADTTNVAQVRTTTWALLADGSFSGRARPQHMAAELLVDDLSLALLRSTVIDENSPRPAANQAGKPLVDLLRAAIEEDPDHPLASARAQFSLALDREGHRSWMLEQLKLGISGPRAMPWLKLAAVGAVGAQLKITELETLIRSPTTIRSLVESGARLPQGSEMEKEALRAVLEGQCSSCELTGSGGFVEDLLRAIGPRAFVAMAESVASFQLDAHPRPKSSDGKRSAAFGRLKARDAQFGAIQAAARFNRGEARSTFPWANTASAIASTFGPCWLAAEIAVIGAATDPSVLLTASSSTGSAEALGTTPNYGELLHQIRQHRNDSEWWSAEFLRYPDQLSRRTWALALVAAAGESVLRAHLPTLERAVAEMDDAAKFALLDSSSRIGQSRIARRIAPTVPGRAENLYVTTLLSHYWTGPAEAENIPIEVLQSMSQFGDHSWQAAETVSVRASARPSDSNLEALRCFSRVEVTTPSMARVTEFGDRVMRDSANYPTSWVVATAAAMGQLSGLDPLAAVASEEHWFSAPE